MRRKRRYNRHYVHARISERRFVLFVRCFAADLTARQCAAQVGMSVPAVNDLYRRLRERIARDELRAGGAVAALRGTESGSVTQWTAVGVRWIDGRIRATLLSWSQAYAARMGGSCIGSPDSLSSCPDAVIDIGLDHHRWLVPPLDEMSGGDPVLRFRRFAKARLRRFNGVARHVFGLHLQECVFRFNHQGEALEELLLGRLLAEPLRVGGRSREPPRRRADGGCDRSEARPGGR
ncbi:MAG: hypothetical protein H3C59_03235 [Burkholderiaceae bacterium]|nr:hypothetical protein [Burkholderiaceae bacterium]